MLKVSIENVTRVPEMALLNVLNSEPEHSSLYMLVEAELERRDHISDLTEANAAQRKIESDLLTKQIRDEIIAIFDVHKDSKMAFLVRELGQDFIDDYVVDLENFTVYSKVARINQNNFHQLKSEKETRSKHLNLCYWRVRDRYLLDSSQENLELLKALLGK